MTDTERIDFLESLKTGYGTGVVVRMSTTGRGMRLHETGGPWDHAADAKPTVREAIDAAMEKADNKEGL